MSGVAEVNPKYLAEAASHTVPVGYKQTEVGVIPEDWEVMRLGHLAKFFKGSGLPKSELSESGKIKCIHYGQLFTTYGPKIDRVISRTKNVGIVTSQENDVLMPTSDVTPNGLATASCITETGVTLGGDILIIRSDKQKLNGVFFSYLVNVLRDQVMQLVTGSTVYHLYGSDMAKFEFAFPSKEEQIAIANALSDVDALISELEKLIAKKQAIKTATMQQLLTSRTRLPQFALREDGTPKGTKPSELGEIPEDWEVNCFAECGYFQSGSGFPTKYQGEQEGDYPFFKVSDMNNVGNETFLISSNNYISESVKNSISAKVIPENAIVFAKIGAAIFLERKKICFQPSCIDNNMMAYIANEDKLQFKYAYLLFKNINLGQLVEATALPSLSGRDIGQKIVALPAAEEQTAIAT
ncbi:MAG: hypothetical protein GX853_04920, partial [Chloroflexi bacterium]|nr:hypothetical protein [Chloroflexota bacterium]